MQLRDIKTILPNPNNPRIIKDAKFMSLVKSIQDFPKMLEKRPLIVVTNPDDKKTFIVLGGNMRLKACEHLKMKKIPTDLADDWTEDERKQFLIKDNVGFGDWDWLSLKDNWNQDDLESWGIDTPASWQTDDDDFDDDKNQEIGAQFFLNIRCDDEKQCQQLYEKFIAEGLDVKIVT